MEEKTGRGKGKAELAEESREEGRQLPLR